MFTTLVRNERSIPDELFVPIHETRFCAVKLYYSIYHLNKGIFYTMYTTVGNARFIEAFCNLPDKSQNYLPYMAAILMFYHDLVKSNYMCHNLCLLLRLVSRLLVFSDVLNENPTPPNHNQSFDDVQDDLLELCTIMK